MCRVVAGRLTRVTIVKGAPAGAHLLPVFLPDGHQFSLPASVESQTGTNRHLRGIHRQHTEMQDQRRVLQTSTHVDYVPGADSRRTMLFLRDGILMAQAFDGRASADRFTSANRRRS